MELCDRCIGRRLIGGQGEAPQREAAAAHRAEHGLDQIADADCRVCEDRWEIDAWTALALAALQPYQFSTFQVGTVFPRPCEDYEKSFKHLNPEIGDTVRTETNRLLATRIATATGTTTAPDGRPDVVVSVDTRFHVATAQSNTIYLEGRYTKYRRDVPQTHWPCKTCQGTGCRACDDSGIMYASSVEQAIGDVVGPAFGATGYSFHGAGREDIDALMIGTGRPFVLELKDPRRRALPPHHVDALVAAIQTAKPESGVGIMGLDPSSKERVVELKAATYNKEYLAHCVTDEDVAREQVDAAAATMTGAELEQRTPERVSHRRADLLRKRTVHHMVLEDMPDARHFSIRVLADSGAYIKEMVSGDEGRTTPNLAHVLGTPCRVEHLDVVAILDEDGTEGKESPAEAGL